MPLFAIFADVLCELRGQRLYFPIATIYERRYFRRTTLSPAQKCNSPDRQPLGYENVAIVEKDGIVGRDEFSRSKLGA